MSNEKKTVLGWVNPNQQPAQPNQWDPQQQPYGQAYPPQPGYPPQQQPFAQQQPYDYAQQPFSQQPQPYPQQYGQQPYPQQPQQPQQPYPQQPAYPQYDQHAYGQYGGPQPPYNQQPYPQAPQQGYDAHAHAANVLKSARPGPADSGPQRAIPGANATVGVSDRVRFIRLTYLHLFGAILAFAGLLYLFMTNGFLVEKVSIPLVKFALGGRWNWGVVLAVFMVVSWVADYWASHTTAKPMQYMGLGIYIVAEALIFVPLLAIVQWKTAAIIAKGGGDPNIIRDAAYTTLGIFAALTASVFITKKDFSFLRSGLIMASGAALMLIILALTFGFNLGLAFSIGMVLLAAGYILYQTSQVLAHYDPNQHVAAALALFSSVALMFWYVIRIFMRARE